MSLLRPLQRKAVSASRLINGVGRGRARFGLHAVEGVKHRDGTEEGCASDLGLLAPRSLVVFTMHRCIKLNAIRCSLAACALSPDQGWSGHACPPFIHLVTDAVTD